MRTLTSVGWIHVRDERLLAVRTRGRDRFYLPGGKPEAAETFEAALARVVHEETSVVMHGFRAETRGEPRRTREIGR